MKKNDQNTPQKTPIKWYKCFVSKQVKMYQCKSFLYRFGNTMRSISQFACHSHILVIKCIPLEPRYVIFRVLFNSLFPYQ